MLRAPARIARRAATGVSLVALALVAVALGLGGGGDETGARLAATSVDGSFSHSNSRDGQPVFMVAGLGPGGSVSGDVTLRNTGTLAGRFTLSAVDVADVPGPNGGSLSQRLRLTVADVTASAQPLTLYDGALAAMAPRDVGVFAPGQARSFQFIASLPDGGSPAGPTQGDNAFQGAQASVGYVWDAVAHGEQPPAPDAQPQPQLTGPLPAVELAPTEPRPRDRQPPRLRLKVPRVQRLFASGHLRLRLRSAERGRVRTRGWMQIGRSRMRLPRSRAHIGAGRTVLLKVRVPARHRRAMRRALIRHRRVTLRIVIAVTDRSGNRTVVRRTLRARAR